MKSFIFNNDFENVIISVSEESTIQELINEYFKRVQKANLITDNIENTYFSYNCKKITNKDYKEKVKSFFEDGNLLKILVGRLDYDNFYRDYKITKLIKNNIYTSVYEAKIKDGKKVAVKKINKDRLKEDMIEDLCEEEITEEDFKPEITKFNKEILNMKLCHCENSVEIYDYFDTEKEFIIIMELCDDTLLRELSKTKSGFDIIKIKVILLQLNNVFKKMQQYKIAHRDIKLNNILVKYLNKEKTEYKILLSDYGISNQLSNLTSKFKTHAGTQITMAPEILNNEKYTDKCDLWSLGIIIYKLKTKKNPYNGKVDKEILDCIDQKGQSILDNISDEKLKDLLSKLLVRNPDKRISWEEYFEHEFFK